MAHDWPGNVRELEHVICRAAILEDGNVLGGLSFAPGISPSAGATADAEHRAAISPTEPELYTQAAEALRRAGGNKSRAAMALGISRKTLYKRLNKPRPTSRR